MAPALGIFCLLLAMCMRQTLAMCDQHISFRQCAMYCPSAVTEFSIVYRAFTHKIKLECCDRMQKYGECPSLDIPSYDHNIDLSELHCCSDFDCPESFKCCMEANYEHPYKLCKRSVLPRTMCEVTGKEGDDEKDFDSGRESDIEEQKSSGSGDVNDEDDTDSGQKENEDNFSGDIDIEPDQKESEPNASGDDETKPDEHNLGEDDDIQPAKKELEDHTEPEQSGNDDDFSGDDDTEKENEINSSGDGGTKQDNQGNNQPEHKEGEGNANGNTDNQPEPKETEDKLMPNSDFFIDDISEKIPDFNTDVTEIIDDGSPRNEIDIYDAYNYNYEDLLNDLDSVDM